MPVKAVLFDLFDTLVIIEGGETFYEPSLRKLHEFLTKNGVTTSFNDFSHIYFEVRDKLYEESSKSLEEPHFNVRVSRTLKKLGYNLEAQHPIVTGATNVFADEFIRYVRLDDDAVEVLEKLHGKYKLGIVSNFAIPEAVWTLLEKFNLKKFFDVIIVSGEINKRKPSPIIFEKALKDLNIKPSDAAFVGDTPRLDVKGARDAGIKPILIRRKRSATDRPTMIWTPPKDDSNLQPDIIIKSLRELLVIL